MRWGPEFSEKRSKIDNLENRIEGFLSITSRVPRRDLIVTKRNGAKIATAQSRWLDHRKPLLQGF